MYAARSSYTNIADAVVNNWGEVGIRIKLGPMGVAVMPGHL
jgi:hypothetical protein